jgi:hypothetical protein
MSYCDLSDEERAAFIEKQRRGWRSPTTRKQNERQRAQQRAQAREREEAPKRRRMPGTSG